MVFEVFPSVCSVAKSNRNLTEEEQIIKVRSLSPTVAKFAARRYRENPDRITEEITELREWIDNHKNIIMRKNAHFLLSFLRQANHDVMSAEGRMERFYLLREKYADCLTSPDLNNTKVRNLLRKGILQVLPRPIHRWGPRLILVRLGAAKFEFSELMQLLYIAQELLINDEDNAIIFGVVYLIDCQNITFKKILDIIKNKNKFAVLFCYAIRLQAKSIHMINVPFVLKAILYLAELFCFLDTTKLPPYSLNPTNLHTKIPPSVLPNEYDGTLGDLCCLNQIWERKVCGSGDYLMEDFLYGPIKTQVKKTVYDSTNIITKSVFFALKLFCSF